MTCGNSLFSLSSLKFDLIHISTRSEISQMKKDTVFLKTVLSMCDTNFFDSKKKLWNNPLETDSQPGYRGTLRCYRTINVPSNQTVTWSNFAFKDASEWADICLWGAVKHLRQWGVPCQRIKKVENSFFKRISFPFFTMI